MKRLIAAIAVSAVMSLGVFEGNSLAASFSGLASYYKSGKRTANGERYNPNGFTAAHRNLPFGTKVRVTNQKTGKSVVVRINDRGPFIRGRVIDVSYGAAKALGMHRSGVARVKVRVLN